MKISNPALHTKVQNWAQDQGIEKPLHDLSLRQLQQAGRAVGADLGEMVQLREELVSNAAGSAMDAGQATAKDRDAAQGGMPMGMGGAQNIGNSPLFVRGNFEKPGVSDSVEEPEIGAFPGKGKGVGFDDTGDAMGSFASRYSSKMRDVKYDGYKGGSSDIDVFYKSGYSMDDAAQLLESYPAGYLDNIWDAKELIGAKVSSGFVGVLKDYGITESPFDSHEQIANFERAGYTDYEARQALAQFPFLHDMQDAREYIGLKVMNGAEHILEDIGVFRAGESPIDLYFKSGYDFDDVETVMREFGVKDYTQAKEYIGQKIARGREDILVGIGVKPHDGDFENMLAFHKSGYSIEDAEIIMEAYSLPDIGEAKSLIGEKVIMGFTRSLKNAGVTPYADLHDGLAAFKRSTYTEADARALVAYTNMFESVQDARAYIGEKVINGAEGFLKDLGITRGRWDSHDELNAFGNSDYTAQDVQDAVDSFSFLRSPDEARAYIGLKVLNGTEDILWERGIGAGGKGIDFDPKGGWNDKGGFYAGKGYYDGFKK
jgi:hypothetical protein